MIGPQQHIRTIVTSFHRVPKDVGRSLRVVVQLSPSEAARLLTGSSADGFGVVAISWDICGGLRFSVVLDVALDFSSFFIVKVTNWGLKFLSWIDSI